MKLRAQRRLVLGSLLFTGAFLAVMVPRWAMPPQAFRDNMSIPQEIRECALTAVRRLLHHPIDWFVQNDLVATAMTHQGIIVSEVYRDKEVGRYMVVCSSGGEGTVRKAI